MHVAQLMQIIRLTTAIVMLLLSVSSAFAQTRVVVVPMAGDDLKPLKNIISVAKANGDFADPVVALNSITDASETNPYLVVIAPGVYDLGTNRLIMKPFVNIAGSGSKVTKIVTATSTVGSNSGAVGAADDSALSDVSITNTGDPTGNTSGVSGLFIDRFSLSGVYIKVENTNNSDSFGLYHRIGSWTVHDSIIDVANSGTGQSIGVNNNFPGALIRISDSTIIAADDEHIGNVANTSCYNVLSGNQFTGTELDSDCE